MLRGARANENGLCWPSACRVRTLLSKRGIASKRCGRDALPSDHHARAPKRGTMPRPPSVLAGGRWLHRTNTSTAPHATCGHHGSTTTAARKANSLEPARRADCSPCGHKRCRREFELHLADLADSGHHLRSALAGPWLHRHPTPGKWPARFFLLYLRCSAELLNANHATFWLPSRKCHFYSPGC